MGKTYDPWVRTMGLYLKINNNFNIKTSDPWVDPWVNPWVGSWV